MKSPATAAPVSALGRDAQQHQEVRFLKATDVGACDGETKPQPTHTGPAGDYSWKLDGES